MFSADICGKYATTIKQSIRSHIKPCEDFYGHVCSGWIATHGTSVLAEVLERFKTAVSDAAWLVKVPLHYQKSVEKAAAFYTSCANVVEGRKSEVGKDHLTL